MMIAQIEFPFDKVQMIGLFMTTLKFHTLKESSFI